MEVLSEHQCQGWLEGYLLTGRHGVFNCYEAFIHIVDSMFNQHAKWLKVTRDMPWRRPIASLNYVLSSPRLAPGPQRVQPPGPGLHRPRGEQEVGRHPRLPAARREHAALGGRPLPPQPPLRQRHRRRQAAEPELADDGRGDPPLHPRDRDLGLGEQRRRRRARRGHGLRRRHPDPRGARRGRPAPPAPARAQGPVHQRRRPDAPPADVRAPARPHGHRVRLAVHHATSRSCSPTTATRGSSTASPTAGRTTPTSTSAATRRRGRRRRRSTW